MKFAKDGFVDHNIEKIFDNMVALINKLHSKIVEKDKRIVEDYYKIEDLLVRIKNLENMNNILKKDIEKMRR